MNDKTVTLNSKSEITAGIYNFVFTPDHCGEAAIQFEIEDKEGQTAYPTANFTVEPYPLVFALANQSAASVHVNQAVTFSLQASEQEAPDSPYTLTYSILGGAGTVKIGESVFAPGTSKTLTKGSIQAMSFIPSAKGETNVQFKVTDMFGQEKTQTLTVDVKQAILNASASTGSLTTAVKKGASFTISASEDNYTEAFKLKYTNSGNGALQVSGSVLSPNTEVNVSSGNTTITYIPNALGDHNLNFTVTDIYGQSKVFSVKIAATYAAMSASASASAGGSVYYQRNSTISLVLAEENYTDNFTVAWSGGNGVMKNGATVYTAGTGYSLAGGTSSLTYTPNSLGEHNLSFKVTDIYGQEKTATVKLNVTHATLTAGATPASSSVYVGDPATTTLQITEAEHTGQFRVKPTITGSGTLTINGTTVASGGNINVSGGNQTIGFTPSATGTHTIAYLVEDQYGQSKTATYTVTATYPQIEASVNNKSIYKNEPTELILNISKDKYGGTYTVVPSRSGSGTLTMGGSNVSGSLTLANGITRFTYTPSTTGNHNITFRITATDGMTKEVTSTITASEAPLSIGVGDSWGPISVFPDPTGSGGWGSGTRTAITISVSKPYYTGTIKLDLVSIITDPADEMGYHVGYNSILFYTDFSNSGTAGGNLGTSGTLVSNMTNYQHITIWAHGRKGSEGKTKTYTLKFRATDNSGNSVEKDVVVIVGSSLPL